MNAIVDNPYRALGLFANCTEREIARQVAKLSAFAEVGKKVEFGSDLPFLGGIDRSSSKVRDAAARIERPANKIHCANFWFVNVSHVDETAFGHLKEGNVEKAGEIWSMALRDKPVTAKNFSAVLNLSTLKLGLVTRNKKLDVPELTSAVQLKGDLIASDAYDSFVELVVGKNTSTSRESAQKEFVDEILQLLKPYFNKRGGVSTKQLVNAFSTFPDETRSYVLGKFTAGPMRRIESEIAKAKRSRIDDPLNSDAHGLLLYEQTQEDLSTLGTAVGTKGVQYQMLVNKVANEILQCSIDYFNELVDDYGPGGVDPGPGAMELIKLVRTLEPTGEIKQRLEDNAPTIEKWVETTRDRDDELKVRGDINFITSALDGFEGLVNNPTTALRLLQSCQPKLEHIAFVLGSDNELYLKISDAVAQNAIGMTIDAINSAQDNAQPLSAGWDFPTNRGNAANSLLDLSPAAKLKNHLNEGAKVMALLAQFDLSPELRTRCAENGRTIVRIMGQLGMRAATAPKQPPSGRRTTTKQKPTRTAGTFDAAANLFQIPTHRGIFYAAGFVIKSHPVGAILLGNLLILVVIAAIIDMNRVSNRTSSNSNSNKSNAAIAAPLGMVSVPDTTFTMGRTQGRTTAESPAHLVSAKAYFIDIYETTNSDYFKFVSVTKYPAPKLWKGDNSRRAGEKFPVVGVSFDDAEAYCRWAGKRLPTEEEWELAARGTDQRIYPWGNDWRIGNANADSTYKDFSSAGIFANKSPFGLYDMVGNAWEWTSSDFKAYAGGTLPKEFLGKAKLKTIRGGSISTPKDYATTTHRIGWQPVGADNYDETGFRCAKDAPK